MLEVLVQLMFPPLYQPGEQEVFPIPLLLSLSLSLSLSLFLTPLFFLSLPPPLGDPARPGNSTVGVVGGGGVGGVPELRRSPSAHFRGFAGASGAVVVGGGAAGGAAAAGGVGGGVGGVGERGGEEGGFFLGGGEEAGWVCVLGEILRVVGVECGESSACLHSISVGKMEAALENWNDADKSTDSTLFYYRWRNYLVAAVATVGACTVCSNYI